MLETTTVPITVVPTDTKTADADSFPVAVSTHGHYVFCESTSRILAAGDPESLR